MTDQVTAKILIGYEAEAARVPYDASILLFKNVSGTIIESDVTNVRRAFEQMVQWLKAGQHPTDQNDFKFKQFKTLYRQYFLKADGSDKYSVI